MAEHGYKHIGILGGMPPAATADIFGRLMHEHEQMFGDEFYPVVTVQSVNTGRVFEILDISPLDRNALVYELAPHLGSLVNAHVDFVIIAANTPHVVLNELQNGVETPIRSIVDATRDEAVRVNVGHPLLLGTDITMTDGFFQRPFAKSGIEVAIPNQADQAMIDDIISRNLFTDVSRLALLRAIQKYSFDGVILGCTELPILIKRGDVDVPLLDTVDIQARDALSQALS